MNEEAKRLLQEARGFCDDLTLELDAIEGPLPIRALVNMLRNKLDAALSIEGCDCEAFAEMASGVMCAAHLLGEMESQSDHGLPYKMKQTKVILDLKIIKYAAQIKALATESPAPKAVDAGEMK